MAHGGARLNGWRIARGAARSRGCGANPCTGSPRAANSARTDRVIEAYIDRLTPEARAQISPQEWEVILPALIELTGTLADDGLVTAALNARSVGVNAQDMAEYIYAWLPHADIEVLAHPDYLAYLHGEQLEGPVSMRAPRTPDPWGNQYEQLETALFRGARPTHA